MVTGMAQYREAEVQLFSHRLRPQASADSTLIPRLQTAPAGPKTHVKRSAYQELADGEGLSGRSSASNPLDVRQPQWLPDTAHTELAMQPARH
jgi:hypothetical protein